MNTLAHTIIVMLIRCSEYINNEQDIISIMFRKN